MASDPHGRIREFVAASAKARNAFLAELVKVPSDNPPGNCATHGARAADLLAGLGFSVERHPVPIDLVRANGMISATNLIVRRQFGDGPTVALNAHGDVVPPGAGWSRNPYGAEVAGGHMYGRGVAVSKSDFATYAFALLALEALGAPLAGSVELHFTYDEEAGGAIGPKWLLDQGLTEPDFALSAGFSYGVVTAHNGCLHLEVEIIGRQAHAALPATGIDALEAANGILTALYAHRKSYANIASQVDGIGSPSLVVGLIEGGVNTNVVPDLVRLRIDRRLIPEENGEEAEVEIRDVVDRAAADFPEARFSVRRIMLAEPFRSTPESEKLAALFAAHASEVIGEPVKPHGVPLYTDARHYAAAGIPTVLYGAGPRAITDANAHAADEHLDLDDLAKATEVVARVLHDILSGNGVGG